MIGAAFGGGFVEAAVVGYVDFAADDGLDASFFARRVEVDHPVEGAVVGDCQRFHSQLFGTGDQVRNTADAVQHAVLGVNVQVREHWSRLPPHKNADVQSASSQVGAARSESPAPWQWLL